MAKYTYVTYQVKDEETGEVVDTLHQVRSKTLYINLFESNETSRVYIEVSGKGYPNKYTISESALNVLVQELRKKMNVVPDSE